MLRHSTPEIDDIWASLRLTAALVLAGLAGLAYLPSLGLPFISDDYVQIHLALIGWTIQS